MFNPNDTDDGAGEFNQVMRVARIGKLYRLIRLMKLMRIFKMFRVVKSNSKLLTNFRDKFKLGQGFERLIFLILMSLMLIHFMACLWVFFASFSNYKGTWMDPDYKDLNRFDQYLASIYFVVQTITTVGYGDFSISNDLEKLIGIFLMWLGVLGFTAGTSFLTTLLDNLDNND